MGQAKQKKAAIAADFDSFNEAAQAVGSAVRRLAKAASGQYGNDCYLHAALGQALLTDLGFKSDIVVGFAAWRIGPNDGDVISHTTAEKSYLPIEGVQGFPYHAWLSWNGVVIDLTTYQLSHKAADLDRMDGGTTQVDWCPDILVLKPQEIMGYRAVAEALDAGHAYYEPKPEVQALVSNYSLSPGDLASARILLKNPDAAAIGPNDVKV